MSERVTDHMLDYWIVCMKVEVGGGIQISSPMYLIKIANFTVILATNLLLPFVRACLSKLSFFLLLTELSELDTSAT